MDKKYKILFVCMGNICRSPIFEMVARQQFFQAGLLDYAEFDSAGTHSYHIGEPPDSRALKAARSRGYTLPISIARQLNQQDFTYFDHLFFADNMNFLFASSMCPPDLRYKFSLVLDVLPMFSGQDVPDPYYGGGEGFEHVLDLAEDVANALVINLKSQMECFSV